MLVYEHVINAVKEVLRSKVLKSRISVKTRKLVKLVLRKWGFVANAIDVALINHRYKQLTFVVSWGLWSEDALFIVFRKDRHGEWGLKHVRVGKRGGWTYRWELVMEEDGTPRLLKCIKSITAVEEEVPLKV